MLRNVAKSPWPGPGGFGDPCGPAGPREAVPDYSWMVAATPGDVFRVVVVAAAYTGPSSHCRIEQCCEMLRNPILAPWSGLGGLGSILDPQGLARTIVTAPG